MIRPAVSVSSQQEEVSGLTDDEAATVPRRSAFWLIAKPGAGPTEALVVEIGDGEQALPVFSFEEEAQLFLHLEELGVGWRARETTAGEVISVLFGPYARVERVVLDPLPKVIEWEAKALLSVVRERFLPFLLPAELALPLRESFAKLRGARKVAP